MDEQERKRRKLAKVKKVLQRGIDDGLLFSYEGEDGTVLYDLTEKGREHYRIMNGQGTS